MREGKPNICFHIFRLDMQATRQSSEPGIQACARMLHGSGKDNARKHGLNGMELGPGCAARPKIDSGHVAIRKQEGGQAQYVFSSVFDRCPTQRLEWAGSAVTCDNLVMPWL